MAHSLSRSLSALPPSRRARALPAASANGDAGGLLLSLEIGMAFKSYVEEDDASLSPPFLRFGCERRKRLLHSQCAKQAPPSPTFPFLPPVSQREPPQAIAMPRPRLGNGKSSLFRQTIILNGQTNIYVCIRAAYSSGRESLFREKRRLFAIRAHLKNELKGLKVPSPSPPPPPLVSPLL